MFWGTKTLNCCNKFLEIRRNVDAQHHAHAQDTEFPGSSFFLAVVWLCHPTAFWLLWFLMRSQLMMTLRIPCMWQATSLTTFKILSLSLSLNQSIKKCLRWISLSSSHPRKPSPLTSGWSWHVHRQKVLWPPHAKSWLIGKDSDVGRDWGQEKGTIEDEMAGWHHWLDGREFEWTPGVGDR